MHRLIERLRHATLLHIVLRFPDRRHFVILIGVTVQTLVLWRERPFPRAPQWQFEIQHCRTRYAWRERGWRVHRDSQEWEYQGVWLTWTEYRWGTWKVSWSRELPPAKRQTKLSPQGA